MSKKIATALVSVACLLIFFGCQKYIHNSDGEKFKKSLLEKNKKIWKKDKCGCKKTRNNEILIMLYKEYEAENKTVIESTKIFGEPDSVINHTFEKRYVYFMNSTCNKGKKLIRYHENSYLIFRNDTLKSFTINTKETY